MTLYGLQRSTLHITKITLKIMFLEQFTCTYTKVFRGFFISCSPILFFISWPHAQLHLLASVGISQRPLGAHPNPLNLWDPQTVKNKEILNIKGASMYFWSVSLTDQLSGQFLILKKKLSSLRHQTFFFCPLSIFFVQSLTSEDTQ